MHFAVPRNGDSRQAIGMQSQCRIRQPRLAAFAQTPHRQNIRQFAKKMSRES